MRDRFGIIEHLNFYSPKELEMILKRSSHILGIKIDDEGISEIARRSRGTPRIVNRLLRRVRDFAEVRSGGVVTKEAAKSALAALEVDEAGLDKMDRQILKTIIEKFSGGPVGIDTIAVAISEEADTITDVYEPFLMQCGFIARTPRGRVVTPNGYEHLGLKPPSQKAVQEEML
jgi:Holliday junction DNA helicase RuvB